jgi:hypothetical protein
MNFKLRVSRVAVLGCLCLVPSMAFANSCATGALSSLIGTTCAIGDVSFAFSPSSQDNFSGVSANSIIFTPDTSSPLNPAFFLSGPFSVTATGSGTLSSENFSLLWVPSILDPSLQITGATALLVNPVVPLAPSSGFINGGNNFGFTNAIVQTGGPNVNPSTVAFHLADFPPGSPDGYFGAVTVIDSTGSGSTTSVDAMEHQYHLAPIPEPSSLLLLGVGLLCLAGLTLKRSLA